MNRPELGQLVEINAKAEKTTYESGWVNENVVERIDVVWKRKPFSGIGVYTGYRHVYDKCHMMEDGESHNDYPAMGDGSVLNHYYSKPIELWKIAINERQNPVYVHPDDVTWENKS